MSACTSTLCSSIVMWSKSCAPADTRCTHAEQLIVVAVSQVSVHLDAQSLMK